MGKIVAMNEIFWRDWNEKTFRLARKEKKPVILDITASWCHWCRVMEETTYNDPKVIRAIAEGFIAVKVDTDRRPDVNSRYNLGGWPTTAFLKPDGELITGSTYIPPEPMAEFLANVKTYMAAAAEDGAAIFPEAGISSIEPRPAQPSERVTDKAISHFRDLLISHFDPVNGGFNGGPKFPMAQALSLALALAAKKDEKCLEIIDTTLTAMARAEIFDSLDGGFFRYATQPDWSAPHWEKLLIDQAELVIVYLEAFSLTRNLGFAEIAGRTLDYLETTLLKPFGRFCGSQEADESYYRRAADKRAAGPAPAVDATIYSGWNARAASAFIKADSVLNRPGATDVAIRTLNFLFNRMKARNGLFWHYLDGRKTYALGLLADQINILTALIDAYEAYANAVFITEAVTLADVVGNRLADSRSGAFFDRPPGRDEIGALKEPYQPIDINAKASMAYKRLAAITGNRVYERTAGAVLAAYSQSYHEYGLLASDYGHAANWLLAPVVEIFLTGSRETVISSDLWQVARSAYHPQKVVIAGGRRPVKPAPPPPEDTQVPAALICIGSRCLEPASDPAELETRLKEAA